MGRIKRDTPEKGRWVLILGGSSGIGKACAEKFADKGYHIIIVHRDLKSRKEELTQLWDQLRARGVQVFAFNKDGVQKESIMALCTTIREMIPPHTIRMVIHCISRGNLKRLSPGDSGGLSREDFLLTSTAMSLSLYDWVDALYQYRLLMADSRILGFSSEGARKTWPHYAAVANAKSSLESLIRHMAYELSPKGIRVNGIRAGITRTPSLEMIPGHQDLIDHALRRNPSKRLTTPTDIANVAYLLSTDEAYWINGAIIPVDGGEGLQ